MVAKKPTTATPAAGATEHAAEQEDAKRAEKAENGNDVNDPRHRHPSDPEFAGQGLDLSVYGSQATKAED